MANIYLISGNDELASAAAANAAAAKLLAGGDGLSSETLRGDRDDMKPIDILKDFLTAIETPAFFGPKKIWLKHFKGFDAILEKTSAKSARGERGDDDGEAETTSEKPAAKTVKAILDALKNAPDDLTVLIDGPGLDRRSAFYKFFDKHGKTEFHVKLDSMNKEYPKLLRDKIAAMAAESGLRVSHDVIDFFAEAVGSDTGRIHSELEKLAAFLDANAEPTVRDCLDICSQTPEAAAWSFADALTQKNASTALRTLDILSDSMAAGRGKSSSRPEYSLLFMAIRKFMEMATIRESVGRLLGISKMCNFNAFQGKLTDVSDSLKATDPDNVLFDWKPFRSYKAFEAAAKFSGPQYARIFTALLDANRELVSGAANPRVVLESLVIAVCA